MFGKYGREQFYRQSEQPETWYSMSVFHGVSDKR